MSWPVCADCSLWWTDVLIKKGVESPAVVSHPTGKHCPPKAEGYAEKHP